MNYSFNVEVEKERADVRKEYGENSNMTKWILEGLRLAEIIFKETVANKLE